VPSSRARRCRPFGQALDGTLSRRVAARVSKCPGGVGSWKPSGAWDLGKSLTVFVNFVFFVVFVS